MTFRIRILAAESMPYQASCHCPKPLPHGARGQGHVHAKWYVEELDLILIITGRKRSSLHKRRRCGIGNKDEPRKYYISNFFILQEELVYILRAENMRSCNMRKKIVWSIPTVYPSQEPKMPPSSLKKKKTMVRNKHRPKYKSHSPHAQYPYEPSFELYFQD